MLRGCHKPLLHVCPMADERAVSVTTAIACGECPIISWRRSNMRHSLAILQQQLPHKQSPPQVVSGNLACMTAIMLFAVGFPAADRLLQDWGVVSLIATRNMLGLLLLVCLWLVIEGWKAVASAPWFTGIRIGAIGFGLGATLLLVRYRCTDRTAGRDYLCLGFALDRQIASGTVCGRADGCHHGRYGVFLSGPVSGFDPVQPARHTRSSARHTQLVTVADLCMGVSGHLAGILDCRCWQARGWPRIFSP